MKNIKLFFLFAFTFLALSSCDDNSAEEVGLKYITINETSKSVVVEENLSTDTELKIFTTQKMSSDMVVNITVNTSMAAENFSVPTSVTIPSGSNEAIIPISITDNSLNRKGETMSISFDNQEGYFSGDTIANLTISVLCPSDLAGSWTYTNGNGKTVSVTETGNGMYTISGDNQFGTDYSFNITDSCGNITVTGGEIEEFDIPVSGSGSVSEDKNTMTIKYTVDGFFTDEEMILNRN
ncbi:exported hypothetical protein [Tenacibaculum litoreum]|uniref:hypothetical protein n=1 Tax=Tenacibaculum litoreum TaxID=321269 RepID=UPI00389331ED